MELNDLKAGFLSSTWDVGSQLKDHIYRRSEVAFAAGDAARDKVKTEKQLQQRQSWLRREFIKNLGGLPSSQNPLNAKVVGKVDCDGFRIEKIIFQSRPKVFVTANLYIPDGIARPRGAVQFLSGHHEAAKHTPEYQTVCLYLVKAGLVVLAQDPVGQGERFSYYEKDIDKMTIHATCPDHDHAGSQTLAVGDSLARYFVHDAMRGIDYLCSRPEVDPKKIGVTGNSGGGTQTSLMMLCDKRIAAAAPGTFIMNRQSYMYSGQAQDAEQIWPGASTLGLDHEDILLMMAPKPVCVLAVKYDFFPIEGTRRTVQRCKRIWKMCDKAGRLDLVEDTFTHSYTRNLARAGAEFFSKNLLGKKVTVNDKDVEPIEGSKLWCTKSGQVRGEIKEAKFVFEENLERLKEIERKRKAVSVARRKKAAANWLKKRVFANRQSCDVNLRIYDRQYIRDLVVEVGFWWSQPGICNAAMMFKDFRYLDKKVPVTIAIWPGGTTKLQEHFEWIKKTCNSGKAVMVLDVTATGSLEPAALSGIYKEGKQQFYGVLHKLNCDLIWLDDSLAAIRVYDVLRAVDVLEYWPGIKSSDCSFYACGRQNLYLQLGSIVDSRIKNISIVEGMKKYADWVRQRYYDPFNIHSFIIPGILQHFDLDDFRY